MWTEERGPVGTPSMPIERPRGDDPGRAVTLRDRTSVVVRPVRPDDRPLVADLFARLSRRRLAERFLTPLPRVRPEWIGRFANVDGEARLGLVAGPGGGAPGDEVIALAQYEPAGDGVRELALVVRDDWQARGLGTALLLMIMAAATRRGRALFTALVNADNVRMLYLLRRHTRIIARTVDSGVVEVRFEPVRHPGP